MALIGNIGVPVAEMYGRPLADAYVVEVSSYQAAEVTVSPGLCVLTSLAPDHLDWHGGEEAYYRDKLRLIEAGPPGELAVNAGSDGGRAADRATIPDRTLFGPSGRVSGRRASGVHRSTACRWSTARAGSLAGVHNVWNLCGAVTAATCCRPAAVHGRRWRRWSAGSTGLPSRCRTVGERDGLTFVDDALASNPFATVASMAAFPGRELTVIVGGADRGVDPRGLVEALAARRPVPAVVVLPPDAERLAAWPTLGRPVRRLTPGAPSLRAWPPTWPRRWTPPWR